MAATGLSRPTVHEICDDLIARGLAVEEAPAPGGGPGRRPRVYAARADAAHVVGVDMGESTVRAAVADLRGDVVGEALTPLRRSAARPRRGGSGRPRHRRRALRTAGVSAGSAGPPCSACPRPVTADGHALAADALPPRPHPGRPAHGAGPAARRPDRRERRRPRRARGTLARRGRGLRRRRAPARGRAARRGHLRRRTARAGPVRRRGRDGLPAPGRAGSRARRDRPAVAPRDRAPRAGRARRRRPRGCEPRSTRSTPSPTGPGGCSRSSRPCSTRR